MDKETRYARITDSGECFKSLTIIVDGVYANEKTWAQHDFKPTNGMVGELIEHHKIPVLKIEDQIYVPISKYGYEEISKEEYDVARQCTPRPDPKFPFIDPQNLDALIGREEFAPVYEKTSFAPKDFSSAVVDYQKAATNYIKSLSADLHPRIKSMIRQLENQEIEQYPYNSVITVFTSWIKDEMSAFNWMPDDYKGVAWLCSLYAEAYVKSLGELSDRGFDTVFADLFKKYHDTL